MKQFASILFCLLSACSARTASFPRPVDDGVMEIGRIQHPAINESSGVVVSRRDTNLFWTHNDGGGRKQVLYAMTRTGQSLGEFFVIGAPLNDWEDIAADNRGHLFVADTGNNDAKRNRIAVYQLDEPDLTKARSGTAPIKRAWPLRFPKKPFDCESLFVWEDYGYVISKVFDDAKAELFRFSLTNTAEQTLERVAELPIDSPVTGADISQDGKLVGVVAKNGAYAFRIHGDPGRINDHKPHHTKLKDEHIEACTFVPDGLLATSEAREIYLFTDEAFISKKKKTTN
jgi:hypothetical protein